MFWFNILRNQISKKLFFDVPVLRFFIKNEYFFLDKQKNSDNFLVPGHIAARCAVRIFSNQEYFLRQHAKKKNATVYLHLHAHHNNPHTVQGCERDECLPPRVFLMNMSHGYHTARAFSFAVVASTPWGLANSLPHPSLNVVERSLLTTAQDSFDGHAKGFEAAAQWSGDRLRASQGGARAPHLVCTEYSRGGETFSRLQEFLSPNALRPVAHSRAQGACFFVTASHNEARALSDNPYFGLTSISPFPSALKVAPGVLEHGVSRDQASQSPGRLATTHGQSMRMYNVEGLNLELSPGTLPAHSPQAGVFIAELLDGLMSESINLHAANVWSDPLAANGEHLTTPGGALLGRDWSMAATLVHELSVSGRTKPGDICSWGSISMHHAASDLLLVSGALLHLFSCTQYSPATQSRREHGAW